MSSASSGVRARQILSLAIPSLGSLLAEPLMVMADSAMVGHLGTAQLAGLTLASSITVFIVGMCIFLVYTTTAVAARQLGAGDKLGAIKTGIDGMWLGLIVGVMLALAVFAGAPQLLGLFAARPATLAQGIAYLRAAAWSLIGMMLVLAGTGALRGQLDTRTPFVISVSGAVANVALNAALIYGARWGVVGAGVGTSIASALMGLAFLWRVTAGARLLAYQEPQAGEPQASGSSQCAGRPLSLRPDFRGILGAFGAGVPLMIRTLTLQLVIMATLWVAAAQGTTAVAGRQIASTTWSLAGNVLDALAIAGQALVGYELGKANRASVRALVRTLARWGIGGGIVIGVILAPASLILPQVFTSDPLVIAAARSALLISALLMPLGGIVYMYDGILIGAGDSWYLALAGVINVAIYAPALAAVWAFAPRGDAGAAGLAWLWACYCGVFFLARLLTLGVRIHRDKWMNSRH